MKPDGWKRNFEGGEEQYLEARAREAREVVVVPEIEPRKNHRLGPAGSDAFASSVVAGTKRERTRTARAAGTLDGAPPRRAKAAPRLLPPTAPLPPAAPPPPPRDLAEEARRLDLLLSTSNSAESGLSGHHHRKSSSVITGWMLGGKGGYGGEDAMQTLSGMSLK